MGGGNALSEWKTHCHWVTPFTRVVVSSDAMTGAVNSLALIAARAVSNAAPIRRKQSRRLCPIAAFAVATATAEQFHPCHHRADDRKVDVIVAVPAASPAS